MASLAAILQFWRSRNPAFFWAPDSPSNLLRDQAGGIVGKRVGPKAVGIGGLVNPRGNSSDSWIEFPTNVGLAADSPFIGMMAVSITNPLKVTGAFLKIGNTSNGLGFGGGASTFDDVGDRNVILLEQRAWATNSNANCFVQGLNIMSFGFTSQGSVTFINHVSGADRSGVSSYYAPSANLYINGYTTSRGTNAKVHAVAIYNKSLTDANYITERNALARPTTSVWRAPREAVDRGMASAMLVKWALAARRRNSLALLLSRRYR